VKPQQFVMTMVQPKPTTADQFDFVTIPLNLEKLVR
jgi:hypothetical protein